MTSQEHIDAATQLLEKARVAIGKNQSQYYLSAAQVHATLAVATREPTTGGTG